MKELILTSFEQKNFKLLVILLKILDCDEIQNKFNERIKDLDDSELLELYNGLIVGGYDDKASKRIIKGL